MAGARAVLLAALAATDALREMLLKLSLTVPLAAVTLALTELKLALAALEILLDPLASDALDRPDDNADEMLAEADAAEELTEESDAEAALVAELRFEEIIDEAEAGSRVELVTAIPVAISVAPP